jgi:hypothetical protein
MDLLQALHGSALAAALREAHTFYPFLNAFHILSFAAVVGAIGTLDLRLLGAFRGVPVAALAGPLSRVAAVGLLAAAVTGFLLFSVQPVAYVQNEPFLVKVGLTVLGVINALTLHGRKIWKQALTGDIAPSVKVSAAASLMIWTSAVVAGRWIAFVE